MKPLSKPQELTPEQFHRQACIAFVSYYRAWLFTPEAQAAYDRTVSGLSPEDTVERIMQWSKLGYVMDINIGRAGILPLVPSQVPE